MPRSPINTVTWWADSGDSVQKSHCMSWSRRLLSARRFWEWMKCWNFIGSRMKNVGVLFPSNGSTDQRTTSGPADSILRAKKAEDMTAPTTSATPKITLDQRATSRHDKAPDRLTQCCADDA